MKGTIKKLENSEIEIKGEIAAEKLNSFRAAALKSLAEDVKMDGFRQGHIPESVLVQNIGEMGIMEEMAELALREAYPKFVTENKLDVLGRPEISITKIAKDNPLEFTIKTAVMPTFKLADYKEIAKKTWKETDKEKIEVTEKEVDDVVNEIRKARAQKTNHAPHKCEDEKCAHEQPAEKEEALPEVNDEFVKSLGNFADVADFRKKLTENVKTEKEHAQKEAGRTKILDTLVEKTDISIPKALLHGEINQILSEVRGKIEQLGLKFEDYLKQIKKTEEDIGKEAEEPARKRVKYKLILKEIAKEENIKIPEEEILKEVENLMKYYEKADFTSAKMYVEDVMTNEKVFELLDNAKA